MYVGSTQGWGFMRFLGAVGIAGAGASILLGFALLHSWVKRGKTDGGGESEAADAVSSQR